MSKPKPRLRLVLGDQLNLKHSWFSEPKDAAHYVLMEVREEATYVKHHIQKIIAFFAAMRAFSEHLTKQGFTVYYIPLDDPKNKHSFSSNISELLSTDRFSSFEYQQPDEWRVDVALKELASSLSVPSRCVDSEHFLVSRSFFGDIFKSHKRYVMENFYREVRRKHGYLMEDGKPVGDRWNFDSENRKKLPSDVSPPKPLDFIRDVSPLVAMIHKEKIPHIGTVDPKRFTWPVTRADSLSLLRHFCTHLLPHFGSYQDAMHTEHRLLFHSKLSFSLNVKLISPHEVISAAIDTWKKSKGAISIEQIEGFVRQIAGWREFMRGVYWKHMPSYRSLNFFGLQRSLPHYFWDGDTKMSCVRHAITQSLDDAYAHHIQRLMITGNFTLLAGIDPDEVDAWYLGVYADALEWVQLPNTRGMSQFADGGIVGTKPYVASANYINKMSNYCSSCVYKFKERIGAASCPFNSLYWNFLITHRKKLEPNPRIGMAYRVLDKMTAKEVKEITQQAQKHIDNLESL